jgi:ribosomal protein S18 acetylase RimI-like enzyme
MTGVQVRWARVEDALGVADVHVASWRAAYSGLIDQRVLDGLSVTQRADGWTTIITGLGGENPPDAAGGKPHRLLVAERDNRIVGWASFGAGRDEESSEQGELAGLYVHPDFWSKKIGHTLIQAVEEQLSEAGYRSAYLWVLAGNSRAISFYDRHRWIADGGAKIGAAGGAKDLRELRHVRSLP